MILLIFRTIQVFYIIYFGIFEKLKCLQLIVFELLNFEIKFITKY